MDWNSELETIRAAEERLHQINCELEESRVRWMKGIFPTYNRLKEPRSSLNELIGDDHDSIS